ncbi:uncharacterized protein PGTG_11760 [Puccinia graminis f. sp. tritici CRL 75-36-700-3]|uniref:HhH-GPD domain-containing protein n=1 Tax=Puccinia graminis f. sp. tritici (strain CRL 75-36-700-3 / race SCCL) TaxID=418459 RepID=E3KM79_PUCGT|nr:uncharacterized protein PGTG_11760 [Puccinia graminis f. sp. tritici CRL 75-36-700-3]EFP85404.2 hypothetical protein PGTG_11760 [Puccinia graminis f. sp. tritici CRL 75-36-700-3]
MASKDYDSDGAHPATLQHDASGSASSETSVHPAVGRSSGQHEFTAKPTISDCQQVCSLLAEVHGGMPVRPARLAGATEEAEGVEDLASRTIATECGEVGEVLDGLVRTILSQHTSRANSSRAKQALDQHFGTGNYHAIRRASVSSITAVLQDARVGLAARKSTTIHALLNHIHLNLNPDLSLEFLRYLPDSEAMETLTSFKGVGAKTASCVLLFCLGRNFFPVDTHVFRITKALGWLPPGPTATRESAFKHLNQAVPDHLKYPLHILLFQHAQQCLVCKRISSKPSHPLCPSKNKSTITPRRGAADLLLGRENMHQANHTMIIELCAARRECKEANENTEAGKRISTFVQCD